MPKAALAPKSHAELVSLSREKGRERERLAADASARGDHEVAAEHTRVAKLYREEADMQEDNGPPRRPGVRTARDKARFIEERRR